MHLINGEAFPISVTCSGHKSQIRSGLHVHVNVHVDLIRQQIWQDVAQFMEEESDRLILRTFNLCRPTSIELWAEIINCGD